MDDTVKRDPFRTRIHEIDFFRGVLICLVVMDHIFNLTMSYSYGWCGGDSAIIAGTAVEPFYTMYRVASFYWYNTARHIVRWFCLCSFCFLSGISCAFSRNNWKRAGQMITLWFIIMVFSNILQSLVDYSHIDLSIDALRVDFNVIGVLAWSTLIYCFVQDKPWGWLLAFCIAGMLLHPVCVLLSWTPWGKDPNTYAVPFLEPEWYGPHRQADFMPLFPYLGFFFAGALVSKFTYSVNKKSYFKQFEWERPFCFAGRHSLQIYILHFAVLIGIFSLIGVFIK